MKERTRSILEIGIKDYIKTGEPITSDRLYDLYNFGIKPAMIRWELSDLTGQGFLSQIHSSGGRLPTNKAYRFFVTSLSEEDDSKEEGLKFSDNLFDDFSKREWPVLIESLSKYLKLLSVGYNLEIEKIYQSGLEELFRNLNLGLKSDLIRVIRDFELLPERLEEVKSKWQKDNKDWPKVYIGENPITRSDHLSLIADKFDYGDFDFIVVTIGPKRMDYKKSLKVLKSLKNKNGRKR